MKECKSSLSGKVIVFDGDSICQGNERAACPSWPRIIGDRVGAEWYNYGVGGGTVTSEVYVDSTGGKRHWVSENIDRIHEKHPTLDYLILEGGTNDADLLIDKPERFGEYDLADYSGNYDPTTFTGALELLFFKAISYYPAAKLGFIVAQKMGRPSGGFGPDYKRRKFFLRAIEVCKKWGMPYIDLWECCPMNPLLVAHYDPLLSAAENIASGKLYIDGQHPSALGNLVISDKIEAWMKTL